MCPWGAKQKPGQVRFTAHAINESMANQVVEHSAVSFRKTYKRRNFKKFFKSLAPRWC